MGILVSRAKSSALIDCENEMLAASLAGGAYVLHRRGINGGCSDWDVIEFLKNSLVLFGRQPEKVQAAFSALASQKFC